LLKLPDGLDWNAQQLAPEPEAPQLAASNEIADMAFAALPLYRKRGGGVGPGCGLRASHSNYPESAHWKSTKLLVR
jgi:hypothetical protein